MGQALCSAQYRTPMLTMEGDHKESHVTLARCISRSVTVGAQVCASVKHVHHDTWIHVRMCVPCPYAYLSMWGYIRIHPCNYVETHTSCACVSSYINTCECINANLAVWGRESMEKPLFLKHESPSADAGSADVVFP